VFRAATVVTDEVILHGKLATPIRQRYIHENLTKP